MNMFGNNLWIWFVVGLIPYYINKQRLKNGWILQVRALFWSLEIRGLQRGQDHWTVRIPVIERLQIAAWAVITHLRRDDSR
jgi:hypothetical protein